MEDSGIDSGDRASFSRNFEDNRISTNYNITESDEDSSSNNNLDVMFKGRDADGVGVSTAVSIVAEVASSLIDCNDDNVNYNGNNPPAINSKNKRNPLMNVSTSAAFSSCKTLQRKLELKVQRVKQSYSQRNNETQDNSKASSKSPSLMPINRLKIPGQHEILPLVEYKSGHSDEDQYDDDDEDISFYPMLKSGGGGIKHELSDTFSLQEMTIMGTDDDPTENEDDDDDSQTLEFLSPKLGRTSGVIDKFIKCFCCINKIQV